jgi:glucarate dehydratase
MERMSQVEDAEIESPPVEPGRLAITAVRATPVSIPLTFVYRWGPGAYPGFTRTLVEVETSEGLTGLGECGYARDAGVINEILAPKLIGANPLDRADCERRALPSVAGMTTTRDFSHLHAYSGIELALWDIAGKATGQSVASLLGGRVRNEVSVTDYFALEDGAGDDFVAIAEGCARAVAERGATVFEGKVGVLPLRDELRYVTAVREAVGDEIPIRLDANMSWDIATANAAIRSYAELGVTWIEEPVLTQAELARLGPGGPISFSSHQLDLPAAARDGVPHAFVVMTHYLGGIRRTVDFVRACALFGIQVWFRAPGTGVATAAELQIAAALSPIDQPSQSLGHWVVEDIVEQGPFQASDGVISVPGGPGLGVTLDRAAVNRCAERASAAPMSDPYK